MQSSLFSWVDQDSIDALITSGECSVRQAPSLSSNCLSSCDFAFRLGHGPCSACGFQGLGVRRSTASGGMCSTGMRGGRGRVAASRGPNSASILMKLGESLSLSATILVLPIGVVAESVDRLGHIRASSSLRNRPSAWRISVLTLSVGGVSPQFEKKHVGREGRRGRKTRVRKTKKPRRPCCSRF